MKVEFQFHWNFNFMLLMGKKAQNKRRHGSQSVLLPGRFLLIQSSAETVDIFQNMCS